MKKRLLIISTVGIISFSGTFLAAWLTDKSVTGTATGPQQTSIPSDPQASAIPGLSIPSGSPKLTMAESELRSLIFDLREKSNEYNQKFEALDTEKLQLETLHEQIATDIEKLLELQVELAQTVSKIKAEQKQLETTRIRIQEEENGNLRSIAATYDKMEAVASSKILLNMTQASSNVPGDYESLENAIKILYFMGDRTKAELLAEMARTQPQLAALFTNKLKEISNPTEG